MDDIHRTDFPSPQHHTAEVPIFSGSNATSIGTPPIQQEAVSPTGPGGGANNGTAGAKATLTIERGEAAGAEYSLTRDESVIGRWDADNGIFPDVDLDSVDQEAKVSRRHARIMFRESKFFLEDLGSTNGTYINRGRRLLPGTPQQLTDGDEIIVGKTFLRFHIIN
jgi:FHA domain